MQQRLQTGQPTSFNRTSVELKPSSARNGIARSAAFNRTSVELKLIAGLCASGGTCLSFNRTSVELKLMLHHR